jgi:uncharacterized protein (UPF0548 family)
MVFFRKPSADAIRRFLDAQRGLEFNYAAVGATAASPPPGYVVDRTRVNLGSGEAAFVAAKAALARWEHFALGWVEACPRTTPLQPGQVVAIAARTLGVWSLNACRIIHVIDEPAPVRRFGFAYGTLPGHVESGEERFLVEWDTADRVWYDILAFSRPNHLLTRLGYPIARRFQKRFARDSAAAMRRCTAVTSVTPAETGRGCR